MHGCTEVCICRKLDSLANLKTLQKYPRLCLFHANHAWRGLLHVRRCQLYPGPCHPSHGPKSTTGALVPCVDGHGLWIKARIYICIGRKRNRQSVLTQWLLKPRKVFLSEVLSKPRKSMFCLVTNNKSMPQTGEAFCGRASALKLNCSSFEIVTANPQD